MTIDQSVQRDLGLVGRRCAQFLLDRLLVVIPAVLAGYLILKFLTPSEREFSFVRGVVAGLILLAIVSGWCLETWWPLRHGGQTPAMRWLGLRIVTVSGEPPRLSAYVIRLVLLVVDGFLWGLVGLGVMLVSPRHRRLGDLVAGTVVVRARA